MSDGDASRRGLARMTHLTAVRFLVFTVVLLALYMGLLVLRDVLVSRTIPPLHSSILIFENLMIYVLMIAAYRGLVRLIEGRKAAELMLTAGTVSALPGLAIGVLLFCAVYAVLWMKGFASFAGFNTFDDVVPTFVAALATAVGEEIVFRGAVFRIAEQGLGTLAAIIISAVLFGLMHAGNDGATPLSTVAIAIEAGVLLGIAYTVTRSLWFPIGIHFGWNFTEGGIFGAPISGIHTQGLFNVTLSGPPSWTGGGFGPEASIVAVAVSLAAAVLLGLIAWRIGQWRPFVARGRIP